MRSESCQFKYSYRTVILIYCKCYFNKLTVSKSYYYTYYAIESITLSQLVLFIGFLMKIWNAIVSI